jgi:tRNA(Ile)-lysidine synthase
MEKINPSAVFALCRFSQMAAWQNALAEKLCDQTEQQESISFSDGSVPLSVLKKLSQNEADYPILYCALSRMTKHKISIDFERFCSLVSLLNNIGSGKIVEIQKNARFIFEQNLLRFSTEKDNSSPVSFRISLTQGDTFISGTPYILHLSAKKWGKAENINKNNLIIHLSCDKIKGELFARNYCNGDQIIMGKITRRVKKLFTEHKIPIEQRKTLPLICDNSGILWIPGIGLSDRARPEHSQSHATLSLRTTYQITKDSSLKREVQNK